MIKEESRFVQSDIMEGMISFRAVIAGMESRVSDRKIIKVLTDPARARKHAGELSYIKAMSFKYGFEVQAVSPGEIEELSVGSSHGGILTLCSGRTLPRLSSDSIIDGGFYMMLDGIEDPYNFGYALRSVYAAGADGVILSPRNWMSAAGVVCRASAGASEQMPLFVCERSDAAKLFREKGYRIVCSDTKNALPMWSADLKKPLFAVIGGERRGISSELMKECDEVVKIEYGRDFPAALSAASAASVLAFEILRQNK